MRALCCRVVLHFSLNFVLNSVFSNFSEKKESPKIGQNRLKSDDKYPCLERPWLSSCRFLYSRHVRGAGHFFAFCEQQSCLSFQREGSLATKERGVYLPLSCSLVSFSKTSPCSRYGITGVFSLLFFKWTWDVYIYVYMYTLTYHWTQNYVKDSGGASRETVYSTNMWLPGQDFIVLLVRGIMLSCVVIPNSGRCL